jgi:bacteriocin-like protein
MKKISFEQMQQIEGGVTVAQYCSTLSMIMSNNPITEPMVTAWEAHCQPAAE